MSSPIHLPVLLEQVVQLLDLEPGARVIDATIDGGGHAAAILERIGPTGRLLGLDRDPGLAAAARQRFAKEIAAGRASVVHSSFRRIGEVARAEGFAEVEAILFDLGLSSFHLDRGGRGFSFMHDEPLDLRFDAAEEGTESAAEILATRSPEELTALFRQLGEERHASRIARAIAAAGRVERTGELFELIRANLPGRERAFAGRSAARIFQALRIAANDELGAVSAALPQALGLLAPGGRLAVISFHSLEDRLVKQFFLAAQREGHCRVLTKRPARPSDAEIATNSRAASAKLRVAERPLRGQVDAAEVERVLRYWIGEDHSASGCGDRQVLWFRQSDATDNYIRERFGDLTAAATRGELTAWAKRPRGRLALVILLDQFNRNLHRGSPRAFAGDEEALRLCLEGIDEGVPQGLRPLERAIYGLPLEHSESPEVQERSVRYFSELLDNVEPEMREVFAEFLESARSHRDTVARFGRFPHRNHVLGRLSTPAEEDFLRHPGSRF